MEEYTAPPLQTPEYRAPPLLEPGTPDASEAMMDAARSRHAADEESVGGFVARRSLPVASTGVQLYEGIGYGQALRRIRGGRPREDDFDTVAEYEQLEENTRQRQQSFGGGLLESAAHLPAIAGEFALAGPALRGMGWAGRTAAAAALPSMGAYTGTVERYNQGRSLPRAVAEAGGMALVNAVILGQLQQATQGIHGVGLAPYARRIAAAGGLGVVEQAAADVLTSGIGLSTGYGTVGDLIGVETDANGNARIGAPRYGAALQHAAIQALTFGAFGALHGRPRDHVTDAFARAVSAERRAGHTEREAAQNVSRIHDLIEGERAEGEITRAEAREMFDGLPDHMRRYGEALADATLPERVGPGREMPGRTGDRGWAAQGETSMSDIASESMIRQRGADFEARSQREFEKEQIRSGRRQTVEDANAEAAERWFERANDPGVRAGEAYGRAAAETPFDPVGNVTPRPRQYARGRLNVPQKPPEPPRIDPEAQGTEGPSQPVQRAPAPSGEAGSAPGEVTGGGRASTGQSSRRPLTSLQRRVLEDRKTKTLDEIGMELGISRQRVEQIEKKAIENQGGTESVAKEKQRAAAAAAEQLHEASAETTTEGMQGSVRNREAWLENKLDRLEEQLRAGEIDRATFARESSEVQAELSSFSRKAAKEGSEPELSDPNILYSGGAGAEKQKQGPSITPFQLAATIARKLKIPGYSAAQAGERPDAKAAAFLREDATVTAPRGQGDPRVAMEEAAHLLGERGKLEVNPLKLPTDVADGFRQFDAPNSGMSRRSMQEGFAQWMVRRAAGELSGLSPAQEAAARFAEKWIKDKGYDKDLNELRDLWQQYNPGARELLSSTGRAPEPIRTPGEKAEDVASGVLSWVQDNIDTNLGPILRAEKYAERTRGRRLEPQERASTWLQQLMYGDKSLAGRMEREGVQTVRDGKWEKIGQSLDEIVAGARPEWLQPTEQGGGSRAGAYHFSRHVLSERDLGRHTVTAEQVKLAERFMEEARADQQFNEWAQGFSQRLHEAFSATRRALASEDIHFLNPKQVENWIKKYPVYTDMASVHERSSSQLKGRQNQESGEQRVDPLVAYKKRLLITSALINEQLKSNAVANLLQMDGMGRFALRQREKLRPQGEAKLRELAERLGETDATLRQMLSELGEDAVGMFQRTPWKGDEGVWNWRGPDGWVSFKLKDRALYDLLTGQQMEASLTARTLNAFANLMPIRALTQSVKFGATTASAAFQVMNIGRDVKTFVNNTVDRLSAGKLPEAYARIYAYEWNRLTGRGQSDKAVEHYFRNRGDQFREFAFDRSRPESAYSRGQVTAWQSFSRFFKDTAGLMGAGEHAPRFQEMLNRYKQLGWDEARLKSEEPPVWMQLEVMNAAQEVTTPFPRLGVVAREANKIIPFLGPHIAGMSKYVRNWRTNPQGAMIGLGGLLATRLVHWLMVKDEEWYRELDARDRYDNIVIPIAGRLYRFPASQGLEVAAGASMIAMLDAAAENNPDIGGAVAQSISAAAGPGLERPLMDLGRGDVAGAAVQGGMQMFGPAGTVAADLVRNQNFRGTPIIPRRDEDLPGNLMRHAVPYAAEQLTGGRGSVRGLTAGVLPLREVRNARRSVDEYYERLQQMEGERRLAQRSGQRYENEAEYRRLHAAEERMQSLQRRLRGDALRGRRVVAGEEPSEEQKEQLRTQMVALARRALGSR